MYEFIEKLFASLIVLVLLIIIMVLAFPDRLANIADSMGTKPTAQDQTGPTPLPKGNVKPLKIVERLPDSSGNQKALYHKFRRRARKAIPPRPKRKRYYVERRRVVYSEAYSYPYRYDDAEPAYESAYDGCNGSSCLCNCKRPYWASEDWNEGEECW